MPDETQQANPEPVPTPTETQNSEINSIPESPQGPMADTSIPPTDSAPVDVSPEAPETSTSPENAIPLKDQNDANELLDQVPVPEISVDPNNSNITIEKRGNDVTITEVMQPTAPDSAEATPDKHSETSTAQMAGNEPLAKQRKENLEKANQTRQEKKRKKIDAILDLFAKQTNLTNDEVEKLLHVSDATATRYLETLEKEGKIKQVGKTGKHTHYERI